jgi:regulator of protease activity HflC (stomatin/prohibitin superfamily)
MFGFFKAQPTDYVIHYRSGKVARSGLGLAFYYWTYNSQIAAIPTSSSDVGFVFNESTNNFQAVSIQGQFTYRIVNALAASNLLDYTIDLGTRKYVTEDPGKLPQRIINIIQMQTRAEIQKLSLEQTLQQSESIAAAVLKQIRDGALLIGMGVELLSIFVISAKPTPEVGKALEADYRETLLRKADDAIYSRRAAAVEAERIIKEKQMGSDIALEEQRKTLIELQGVSAEQEAEYRGKAFEVEAAYKTAALEKQLAVYDSRDAKAILALAIRDLAANAEKIGNLNISPDILAAILNNSPV